MDEPKAKFTEVQGTLIVEGDLSAYPALGIKDALSQYLGSGQCTDYCIDLTRVDYCNLNSMVSILRYSQRLVLQGKRLRLKVLESSHVYRVLKRSGLLPSLTIEMCESSPESIESEIEINEGLLK